MKIAEFKEGFYIPVREVGNLKPLAEVSLAEQLSAVRQEMHPSDPAQYLVFALEEKEAVFVALGLLARNMGLDRGLGRVTWLDQSLLEWIASQTGWESHFIPTDGNATVPIPMIVSWSLAFRPLA